MRYYSVILQEDQKKSDLSRRKIAKQTGMSERHLRYIEREKQEHISLAKVKN